MFEIMRKKGTPLYVSIYHKIKEEIEERKLRADEKLPSKRCMSEILGVSTVTVENAYSQLMAEGYIYSREKVGYFVSELPDVGEEKNSMGIKEEKAGQTAKYPVDLCKNSIDCDSFPFSTWSKLMRKIISENYDRLLEKVPNMGLWELRKSISEYLFTNKSMEVDPNCILIGAGAEYMYGLLVKLLGRDNTYAIEDPGYQNIFRIYRTEGVPLELIGVNDDGIDMDDLENSSASILHISPSHHFPTGVVTSITRRKEILNWACEKEDRFIIEDDYDSEFRFTGMPIPSMYSIDRNDNTIYINTYSKTISPSLRISYMILPEKLVRRYREFLDFYSCTVTSFEQYTLSRFISDGHFERHIRRMRKYYRNHRDEIISLVSESTMSDRFNIREEASGLHFLLELETGRNDSELKEKFREKGLNVGFLSDYSHGDGYRKSTLVINYSGISVEDFKKALSIIEEVIAKKC